MKLTLKLLTAFAVCGLLTGSALAQGRIATVNLPKVFENYWKTKAADANLKDQAGDIDKERKGLLDEFNKANEEYKKLLNAASDPALSSEERDKRKAIAEKKLVEMKDMDTTIRQYDASANETLKTKQRRMRDNLLGEIRSVINAKARDGGYALVLDSAAETKDQTPFLLFQNGETDITDAVLQQLNASAPADLPKADAPKEEPKDAPKKDTSTKDAPKKEAPKAAPAKSGTK